MDVYVSMSMEYIEMIYYNLVRGTLFRSCTSLRYDLSLSLSSYSVLFLFFFCSHARHSGIYQATKQGIRQNPSACPKQRRTILQINTCVFCCCLSVSQKKKKDKVSKGKQPMTIQSTGQSTWGEKGAYNIDSGLVHVYANANALRHRLEGLTERILGRIHEHTTTITTTNITHPDSSTTTAVVTLAITTFFAALAIVAVIMSWRNLWRRNDPNPGLSSSSSSGPPHVSDNDYSYITHDDIGGPPEYDYRGRQQQHQHQHQRRSRENTTFDDKTNEYIDSDPDILLLKHHKYKYTLAFPAYAIDDGVLRVGDLRRRAAEVTRTPDPQRVKLLYKGKLLDEDGLPCKAEGMKQESEVLCVVSEVQPDETSDMEMEDGQAVGGGDDGSAVGSAVGSGGSIRTGSKRKNKKKNKNKRHTSPPQQSPPAQPTQTQPQPIPQPKQQQQQQQPSGKGISTSASSLPAPAPNLKNFTTAHDQVHALSTYLHNELLPLCDEYTANTPTDPKLRDFEHKKISETVLAQVLLKADGIEPMGNPDVRNARKQLVRDAQSILNRVDQASKTA